eukprot:Lithocolla_globosa_v1_NODE_4372_length_1452_cov_5.637079.p1 type:complete len:296 gc:universal NODE_4372_length_1452_cov_5.637079:268-1155(+)
MHSLTVVVLAVLFGVLLSRITHRKLFNLGHNKTGTTSFSAMMEIHFGYKTCHNRCFDAGDDTESKYWTKMTREGFDEYDAFSDHGQDAPVDNLINYYPDARFVVTTRPLLPWLISRYDHIERNKKNKSYRGKYNHNGPNEIRQWIHDRNSHFQYLYEFFKLSSQCRVALLDPSCPLMFIDFSNSTSENVADAIGQFLGVAPKHQNQPDKIRNEHSKHSPKSFVAVRAVLEELVDEAHFDERFLVPLISDRPEVILEKEESERSHFMEADPQKKIEIILVIFVFALIICNTIKSRF